MKNCFLSLVLFLFFPLTSGLSAESTDNPKNSVPVQPTTTTPKLIETRDAFLAFAFEKAKTYSEKAELAVSKAVDVVSSEAPEMLKEFLRWRACMHGLKGLAPIVLMGLSFWMYSYSWPRFKLNIFWEKIVKGEVHNVIFGWVGLVGIFAGFITMCVVGLHHFMSFVQILVAPRIYIIEQVTNMFKQ